MASNKISLFFKSLLLGIFISGFGVNGHAATLPSGYTELEYIQSTGTQYIDTGYIPTTDLSKIEFKFNVSTDNTTIFGVSNSSESRVQMWHYQDRYSSRTFTNTTSNISSVVLSLNIDITGNLDVTNGKLTINGNSGISTDIDYKTNYSYPMYVFALNNEGATPTTIASGKVYYLKVYENGTLIRDFVPAKNSSGVVGMYDTVSGTFFTNAGTGTFTGGEYPSTCNANTTNLANMSASNVVIGQYIASNGVVGESSANFYNQEFIPVQPNKTYTLGFDTELFFVSISEYDENQTFIKRNAGTNWGNTSLTITTGATTKYIRFGSNMYGNENTVTRAQVNSVNWMLTETSTAQPYVPYSVCAVSCPNGGTLQTYISAKGTVVQNGTPTPTNPIEPVFYKQGDMVLRKVGDIEDSYDAPTGKITRRVGVKVFDGTEDWVTSSAQNVYRLPGIQEALMSNTCICSHYLGVSSTTQAANMPDLSVRCGYVGYEDSLYIKDSTVGNLTQFKQFLAQQYNAGTPVTVYYPLATETTEDWVAEQCTSSSSPIKIATTAYNSARFSPVVTELNDTIATIRSVVTNTINQTKAIADLQATKQTRPDENCPAGKKCLLVEDNDGQPHWYEIIESASRLPSGYTELQYIQSTGTQYIDTGIARGSSNFVVEYDINMVTAKGARFAFAGASWNVSSYLAFDASDNTFDVGQGNTEYVQGALNTRYKLKAEYKVGSIVLSLYDNNETLLASTTRTSNTWGSSSTDSWLFGTVRNIPSGTSFSYTLKSFGGKIWQGTTLVRNLIPAKNSSGVIGMYDTVSGTFFTNQGTGTFDAGPEVQ